MTLVQKIAALVDSNIETETKVAIIVQTIVHDDETRDRIWRSVEAQRKRKTYTPVNSPEKNTRSAEKSPETGGYINIDLSNTETENTDPPILRRNPKYNYGADFLSFWNAYPRRVGKGAAWRAWQRERPDLAQVLGALAWQTRSAEWCREGGTYVPHPTTYINHRRWEDEPKKPPSPMHLAQAVVPNALSREELERIAASWDNAKGDE